MSEKTFIKVKSQFVGFHRYVNAPDEVAFLRNPHRHIFHVTARIEVFHDDRELEFFLVKKEIGKFIDGYTFANKQNLGSCEMMAQSFVRQIRSLYGLNREICVEVSEDGENSAEVWFCPSDEEIKQ